MAIHPADGMVAVRDCMRMVSGFTNMAQVFVLAETMYTSSGRKGAQSALLVITDGKPSFHFQTNKLAQQLDDKDVQFFFVVVTDNDKSVDLMKTCASDAWEQICCISLASCLWMPIRVANNSDVVLLHGHVSISKPNYESDLPMGPETCHFARLEVLQQH